MKDVMDKLAKNIAKSFGQKLAIGFLVFLSLNILADRFLRGVRLDLTQGSLYTLSQGTLDTVTNVPDPVEMTFYFSRTLATPYASLLSYGKRIEDLLNAMADESGGRVSFTFVDPEPYSETEDAAVEAGLKGIPLPSGETLYMGLSMTNDTDGSAIIPFFIDSREKFLEYDVAKLIVGLDSDGKPKLGVLSSLPLQFGVGGPQAAMQGQSKPYVIYTQLEEAFDLLMIEPGFSALPEALDVLLVAHPSGLNEDQLFAIDQYVLAGGKAVVFVDPHAESISQRAQQPNASDLAPLLKTWGLELVSGKVLGDIDLAQRISMGGYGPDSVKNYAFWLNVQKDNLNADDMVTGAIENMALASVGVLKSVENSGLSITPLVTSSKLAALFDASRSVGRPDPDALLRDLEPTTETYTIAARVQGNAKSAYPARAGKKDVKAYSGGDVNVVVMADTDLFDDKFWVQEQNILGQRIVVPTSGNGAFVLSLLEQMAGSSALINLRSRGVAIRPFEMVNDIRKAAEAKFLVEEQALEQRLQSAEAKIAELEQPSTSATAVFSADQEAEVEKFRAEMLETRKALREVKRGLRRDIESLESKLIFFNIILMPFLVMIVGVGVLTIRRRKSRNRSRS